LYNIKPFVKKYGTKSAKFDTKSYEFDTVDFGFLAIKGFCAPARYFVKYKVCRYFYF
jgi:hypothetical protein